MSDVEVSVHVETSADAVYALVSDLTRMGQWSPECTGCTWRGGATGPTVGAAFKGRNRKGIARWSTNGEVVEATAGRAFAFDVTSLGQAVARWGYRIEPDADGAGCTLTETWDDHRRGIFKTVTGMALQVPDRARHNTLGMEATLAKMKAAAETAG